MSLVYRFSGVLSVLFFISSFTIKAQDNWSELTLADSLGSIQSINYGYIHSSSVANNFTNKFIWGGFIDENIKDNSLALHKNLFNYLEAQMQAGLQYQSAIKNNWFWGVNYNYVQNNYAKYPTDLFELVFKGNENLPIAQLSETRFFNLGMQQAGFVVGKQFQSSSSKLQLKINPFVNISHQYNLLELDGVLNTSDFGDEISYEGSFKQQSLLNNGLGAGLNLAVFYQKNKNLWRLDVKNLGFVNLETEQIQNKNTFTNFSGVSIEDIFAFENVQPNLDNITDTLIETKIMNERVLTPFSIQLSNDYLITQKHSLRLSARYFNAPNFVPQLSIGYNYQNNIFQGGVNANFGGYTNFMVGAYVGAKFNSFTLGVGTNNLLSWIVPQNTLSQAIFVQLKYNFN
jgi:hypothetical protein